MGGWARTGLNITPSGKALPCHAAETIPTLQFDNVRDKDLETIWYEGRHLTLFAVIAGCRNSAAVVIARR